MKKTSTNRLKFNSIMKRMLDNRRIKNVNNFLNEVETARTITQLPLDAQTRINNDAKRMNDDPNAIFREMKKSERLARNYAKSTTKQNHAEKYQISIIERQFKSTTDFEKITGNVYVENGSIKTVRTRKESTSIDTAYTYKGVNLYSTLKFTTGQGGGQDRQFGNVLNFLTEGSKSRSNNNLFIAVLDGTYYTPRVIEDLKDRFSNKSNIIITDSYSFKADVDKAL